MEALRRPLDGIIVIDLTHALSGPICTCMLADFGARVIKVENASGDLTRGENNPNAAKAREAFNNFNSINRNKDAICLNLRDGECMAIFLDILKKSDVLISNYRPGTTKKMGIDYESLKEINPRLICCEISAFREKGREGEPGFDVVVQAASGIIACTGYPEQPYAKPGPSLADVSAGMMMTQGVLLALLDRVNSSKGQAVSVRMQDSAMFLMPQYAPSLIDDPEYEVRPNGMCHFEATPSNGFKTSDGYVFIAPAGDKLFPIFCNTIGRSDVLTDPRFTGRQNLIDNRSVLYTEILDPLFLTKTTDEWYQLLSSAGLPVSPIATPKQAWTTAAKQGAPIVATVEHSRYGNVHVPGVAIDLSETPGRVEKAAPDLGQNTEEILRDFAGLSLSKINELEERGVICCKKQN